MNALFLFFLFIISLVPLYTHLHIVVDDFASHQLLADSFYKGLGYCFELISIPMLDNISGLSGRPPLVSILLAFAYKIFGHDIFATYITYAIPRVSILLVLYLLSRQFFRPVIAFLTATMVLFFPYFETVAISSLKADVFVVLFSLTTVYLCMLWNKSNRKLYLFLTGIFIALNFLTKETASGFSAGIFIILFFRILKRRTKIFENLIYLTAPVLILAVPFVLFSLIHTGRVLPQLFATGRDFGSFPMAIYKYLMSVFYYAGANLNVSSLITLNSLLRSILIVLGAAIMLKKGSFEVVLPVLFFLAAISIHPAAQGGVVGNREILHRIALVVPFSAIYMVIALEHISLYVLRRRSFHFILVAILVLTFVNLYLREPFAVAADNSEKDFYINASVVFRDRTQIPFAEFSKVNNDCVLTHYGGNEFLINHYKKYKSSAFPRYYKKTLVLLILLPLFVVWFKKYFARKIRSKK